LVRVIAGSNRRDLVRSGHFEVHQSVLGNTGWTDEARAASLAVRRAKAKERRRRREIEELFEWQRQSRGRDFMGNWYPRGRDGRRDDPHYGKSTEEAPYGWIEGTLEPRKEPLYDGQGRPIIPRPWKDIHRPEKKGGRWKLVQAEEGAVFPTPVYVGGEAERNTREWLKKKDKAEAYWGRFGRKKRWFDKNPDATEEEWEKHDEEQRRKYEERRRADDKEFERWQRAILSKGQGERLITKPGPEDMRSVDSGTGSEKGGSESRRRTAKRNRQPMNTLILNRDTFEMPADGWYQIAPLGEFPHRPSGVVQVVDKAACDAMANAFREEAGKPNFAGLLIDFDHFSLDDKLKSEAAGWISELENRDAGLWAKIRWSDVGEECVKGGRYRFISPVWSQRDCEDLGNGRLRPVKLLNAAVTNDPNLKGMVPLSNRDGGASAGGSPSAEASSSAKATSDMTGDARKRLKWTLGDSPDGRHCPSCQALAGQVHTKNEWDAAGIAPGADGLYCEGDCHCSLVETDDPATGKISAVPQRKKDETIADREAPGDALANIGWTDAARAASLAVRQAKAAARHAGRQSDKPEGGGGSSASGGSDDTEMTDAEYDLERTTEAMETYRDAAEQAFMNEYGYLPTTPEEIAEGEDLADIPERYRTNGEMTPGQLAEELLSGSDQDDGDPYASDYMGWFEDQGFAAMSPEAVEGLTDQIREKLRAGESLDAAEAGFLEMLSESGYAGESEGDPIFRWQEQQSMAEAEEAMRSDDQPAQTPHERAEDLIERVRRGEKLSAEDQHWLDLYRDLYGIGEPGMYRNDGAGETVLANIGWTDEARQAALEVRRAKAAARATGKVKDAGNGERRLPERPESLVQPDRPPWWPDGNGSPWPGWQVKFDERLGHYVLVPIDAPWRPAPGINFPWLPPGGRERGGYPIPPEVPRPIRPPHPRIGRTPQAEIDAEKMERRRFVRSTGR